jgi:mevalonate kinase
VYGRPALVAAVDRRLTVELTAAPAGEVRLALPAVAVARTVPWPAVRAYARDAAERWRGYERDPGPEGFARLRGDDPAHLVLVALGEAVDGLAVESPPGLAVRVASEIPIGSGFGSSAALAVALLRGVAAACGRELADDALERLALEVERRQHGLPSGVDTATVHHGGVVWAERDDSGRLRTEPIVVRSPALGKVRVFNTGEPRETTGAVVAAVRRQKERDPAAVDALLDRMEKATRGLRDELASAGEDAAAVTARIGDFEACLEALGVVPEPVRRIVHRVAKRGGAAKISGAGALTGRGAGSLLVYHPAPGEIDRWDFLRRLDRLDLRLGVAGVQLEE